MEIHILTHKGLIGSLQARVIDESMGVIGGEVKATDFYLNTYQDLFRKHTLKPDWNQVELVGLKAITETGHELSPCGGIGITDLEEYPDEITIEVCGLSLEDVALTRAS
jgi:hypothetical protein